MLANSANNDTREDQMFVLHWNDNAPISTTAGLRNISQHLTRALELHKPRTISSADDIRDRSHCKVLRLPQLINISLDHYTTILAT